MSNRLKKVIGVIIIILMVMTICVSTVYAAPTEAEVNTTAMDKENDAMENNGGSGTGFVDGITGLLLWPVRLLFYVIGVIVRAIAHGIAAIGGGSFSTDFISIGDIFFNKVELVKIDFFNLSSGSRSLNAIRTSIAAWYYSLRNLSIALSLVVLLYVGIRMAISTVASEEAKYKKMLTDWVVGFALLFILHFIIIFTININNSLVDIFAKSYNDARNG